MHATDAKERLEERWEAKSELDVDWKEKRFGWTSLHAKNCATDWCWWARRAFISIRGGGRRGPDERRLVPGGRQPPGALSQISEHFRRRSIRRSRSAEGGWGSKGAHDGSSIMSRVDVKKWHISCLCLLFCQMSNLRKGCICPMSLY